MPTREDLLEDLNGYTVEQIAEAVDSGQVTLYELSKTGMLTPRKKP